MVGALKRGGAEAAARIWSRILSPLSSGWLPVRVLSGVSICLLAAPLVCAAPCTAPATLAARLKQKPSGENFAATGNWFADHKQFSCAAEAFSSAVKMQPSSLEFNYLWGLSLFSAGQIEKSTTPLRHAIQISPGDLRPHLMLAAALDKLQQSAAAQTEWRAALAIDPDSEPALNGLSNDLIASKDFPSVIALLAKSSNTRIRSAEQSLNLGVAYAATARLDEAAAVLREGLNTAPDSLPIANKLAIVLMLLSRVEEAYAVLDLALARHPGDLDAQILYLRILVSSHSDKAQALAAQLLSKHPQQWEVLYLNGVLETREGNLQQARTHLERSVTLNAQNADSQKALGSVLATFKEYPAAREHLEKAIALGDSLPEVQYDLAKVLQSLGQTDQARERLRIYQQLKKAQSDRTQAAGKAESGDQAIAAGNAAQAVALYREALVSNPTEPLLYYKLAKALEKTNDLAEEKIALQRAVELNPNLAEAENQLGYLLVRSGDSAQAESCFRAATHASPSYVGAWINLAATLAGEARWQEAKQASDRALEIDPDNTGARQLSQAIAAQSAQ